MVAERELVAELSATRPGPELHALIARCRELPMTAALASAVLEATTRLLAGVEALRLEAVAAVSGPPPADPAQDFAEADVAVAGNCSTVAAGRLIALARTAVLGPLSPLHRRLREGRTSVVHLICADTELAGLTPELAEAVLAEVLAAGGAELEAARFRDRLRRAVRRADAGAELRRRRNARGERRVSWWADRDGLGHLHVVGDLDRVARAYESIRDRAAAEAVDDGRGADARRADTALDLLTGRLGSDGPMPTPLVAGRGEVLAFVAADALSGTSPASAATREVPADERVAELVGAGPVLAGTVRALATDHVIRRVVLDPATGGVLDTSLASRPRPGRSVAERVRGLLAAPLAGPPPATDGYVPSVALARHVAIRDRRCAIPGCRARAARCDLDHARPYPHGPTSADNLGALCRRHHRLKTVAHWTLERAGPHTTWTTVSGRRVAGQCEDYRWLLA